MDAEDIPAPTSEPVRAVGPFRRLLTLARPYRRYLAFALSLSAVVSGLTALTAWLLDPVLEGVFLGKRRDLLILLPVALVGISLTKGLCRYGHAYFMDCVSNLVMHDLRLALYRHVIRLPVDRFTVQTSGGLVARVISDVSVMQEAASLVVKELIQNTLTLSGLVVVIFLKDWQLGPFAIIVLPLVVAPVLRIGRRLRRISKEGQVEMGRMTDHLQETFVGVRLVKTFAQEDRESQRFGARASDYQRTRQRAVRISEIATPLMELASSLGLALILYFGGQRVIEGQTTAGELTALLAAIGMMYAPLKGLSKVSNRFQRAMGAAERVFEVLDWPLEVARDRGDQVPRPVERALELRGVSFVYPGEAVPSLHEVSLTIGRGEAIALVGPSGSGKSTLAALLSRFYDPTGGEILWDGVPLAAFRLAELRRQVGFVSQDVVLFDGTVRDNITYGVEAASEEAIIQAARAAHADEFLRELPQGYDTRVGERGVRLSGGQKQRIAIARTLLMNPPVLVLDEATSALDTESESIVQEAIANLMEGRTTLMIAHRLSSIRRADRIVVLDRGRVVEQGRRDDLMGRPNGAFRRLVQMGEALE